MAEPIHFPEANGQWTGQGDIGDLPALTADGAVLSCWQLSEEEQEYVATHGRVWLMVWGPHPPVSITAADPFASKDRQDRG